MATILVADDDQLFRAIIRDQLELADHTVLEAGDGMAALDLAMDERPEVLLLDVMMPLARGLEVVRRVRQQEGWHPAIIMISARTRVTDRLNALEAGADAYVEKPVAPDELLDMIDRLLSDVEPARYVDLLGPVWTTLAIERLTEEAISRRGAEPQRLDQLEGVFSDLVAASVGRMPGPAATSGPATDAMRVLWEDAIRALLRDSVEPVPVVTDVAQIDALAAVERVIGDQTLARHRAQFGPAAAVPGLWQTIVTEALGAPVHPAPLTVPSAASIPEAWTKRLRQVLGEEPTASYLVDRFGAALKNVLPQSPADDAAAPTIDPLHHVWLAAASRGATGERVR
jgi:two-component system, OmpR family, response regulator MprA